MKNSIVKFAISISTILLTIATHPAFAQVVVSTNAAGQKTNSTLQLFLDIVVGVSGILCTGAVTILGYKAWYEPNFKISDGKNIIIGGVLVSTAGALAAYFR